MELLVPRVDQSVSRIMETYFLRKGQVALKSLPPSMYDRALNTLRLFGLDKYKYIRY